MTGTMREAATSRKPNVLIVLVDQMRRQAMGCAGDEQAQTPNLDRFAGEGASMDCAVSNIPVCTPARACLLTGRYPLSHTVLTNNSMLPPDMPSMGKMMKADGHATGYIGKWHLAGEGFIGTTKYNGGHEGYIPPGEMRHGFDYWAVHHCSHKYRNAFYYRDDPVPIQINGWEPDGQTDLAIDFMRRHAADCQKKPFFLVVSWGTPHTPFSAPPEFERLFDPGAMRFRENVEISESILKCDNRLREITDPEEALRIYTARYYASIANIDWNFGRLLEALDRLGLRNDTILIFTSDHGEMLGSHGQMHKVQPWDESIRIPFLIRYPGHVKRGLHSDAPFSLTDVLPTAMGLAGTSIPSGIEGADFSPMLRGLPMRAPESSFLLWPCNAVTWGKRWGNCADEPRGYPAGFMRPYRGIRTGKHTYVRDRNGPWFLYDNTSDPFQKNNLVAKGGGRAVPPELEKMLADWLARTGDAFEDSSFYQDNIDLETGLATGRGLFLRRTAR